MPEVLLVLVVFAMLVTIAGQGLKESIEQARLRGAVATVRNDIRRARMNAVKERVDYRIVINDESDTPPNTLELQKLVGGSFQAVDGNTHAMSSGVYVLGSTPTDSLDVVAADSRGACTTGNIYLATRSGRMTVLSVSPSCGITVQ